VWISIIVFVDAFLYDCIVRYLRKFQGVLRKLAALGTSFLSDLHTLWEPQGDHRAVKGGLQVATSHLQIHWGFLSAQELTAIAITHGALLALWFPSNEAAEMLWTSQVSRSPWGVLWMQWSTSTTECLLLLGCRLHILEMFIRLTYPTPAWQQLTWQHISIIMMHMGSRFSHTSVIYMYVHTRADSSTVGEMEGPWLVSLFDISFCRFPATKVFLRPGWDWLFIVSTFIRLWPAIQGGSDFCLGFWMVLGIEWYWGHISCSSMPKPRNLSQLHFVNLLFCLPVQRRRMRSKWIHSTPSGPVSSEQLGLGKAFENVWEDVICQLPSDSAAIPDWNHFEAPTMLSSMR
jgi:hypothetical protein